MARRRVAVRNIAEARVAVVSFTEYLDDERARSLVDDTQVLSLMVALPGGAPDVVSGDLADWVAAAAEGARAELASLEELLPSVTDPEFQRVYRADIDRYRAMIAGAENDVRLVFGVVVRADADVLQRLTADPRVRLVDVGANDASPSAVLGLRPEEETRAGEPEVRPR